ncbi:putative amino acid permease YbgF [Pseudomonas reidholzensis]|uniref:Putative amino acid permease YbgF n=1 Tax=Pseudomonas reidholzensis TaxID=1785162 RepID=A0A383RUV2_9PSED|nr:amino acid permease [Pseudomonas reidholzensis]SYX90829.1 putative amino acid permease YbgF [Pseudomonas reidholzensis]
MTSPLERPPRKHEFRKDMQARHLVMLAIGGTIGTGLFLASGFTVSQAGPLGAVIAYAVGAIMIYCVMCCLGELAVQMPETGSFSHYATRYIGPATGYTVAWLYWLSWAVAIGSELLGAGVLLERWFPGVPVWFWAALLGGVITVNNLFSVRAFAETEFWLSLIKVITVVVFIIVGGLAVSGVIAGADPSTTGFANFTREGWFPTGFGSIGLALLAVAFAFAGTEVIGIAAGETQDPQRNIPRALRATVLRLVLFFIGTILVICLLLPREQAGLTESPFVTVFSRIGIPYAADIMNFVIITSLVSAANSGLYAAARMLWTLGDQGQLPRMFSRLTRRGTPVNAILFSMVGGIAALLSSVWAPQTIYLLLVSIAGFAIVAVWISIAVCQILFRRDFLRNGGTLEQLSYKVRWYPWVPIVALICCLGACVGIGFDPEQRIALYVSVPFIALCYGGYYATQLYKSRTTPVPALRDASDSLN